MKKNDVEEKLYQRLKRTENVGDSEFGNIELSYNYCREFFDKSEDKRDSIKILDIGTNRGTLPWMLYKDGYKDVYGIDLREEGILSGKSEYKDIADHLYYNADAFSLPFNDNSFDVICMFDVIEHIPDVQQYLAKEVKRVLKQDGVFIFQTPNKPMNIIFEIIRNRSFTQYKEYHCSLQTAFSLRRMLKEIGFEEITIEKYTLYSELNLKKVKKYFGVFGDAVMKLCSCLPLVVYPNLWGHAKIAK